jgi:hypothetical protein
MNLFKHTVEYLMANDIKLGRHTKHNVLNAMMTHPQATDEIRLWAAMHA